MSPDPQRLADKGVLRCIAAVLPMCLGGCTSLRHGFLDAAGPVAGGERHLFLIMAVVLVFVAGPVLILTPLFAWHYRLSNTRNAFRPDWNFSWPLEGFIWIPPSLIVVGLAWLVWTDTHRFDPYAPIKGAGQPIEIQAVALDWKWLFIYPDQHVATVNELDIPAGRPVHLQLTSGTVMQSMLLPQLAGQIYAMAGMSTQLNFAADHPGVYLGENTQYNGDGFQAERFAVKVLPPADYRQWIARVQKSAGRFDDGAYDQLARRSIIRQPIFFSSVPSGLYQHILRLSTGPSKPQPQLKPQDRR